MFLLWIILMSISCVTLYLILTIKEEIELLKIREAKRGYCINIMKPMNEYIDTKDIIK